MQFSASNTDEIDEIKKLFTRTFTDSENETEGRVVGELAYELMATTDSGDLFVFVARDDANQLAGCIIFSRLVFASGISAFLLSPVAVDTEFQGHGIGQALINHGLNALREQGVELVFTYGDPNFYSRVGFSVVSETVAQAPQPLSHPEGWLGQSLMSQAMPIVSGRCQCVAAMDKPEIW